MPEPSDTRDVFYRQDVYPEVSGMMSWSPAALEQIKDAAIVVVDTNALLVPYGTGKASLEEIGEKYRTLVAKKRLIVPGQVVREFASNRATKLQELNQQLNRKRQLSITGGTYPLLEGLPGYEEMLAKERQLERSLKSYRDAVDSVLVQVRQWHWNDPVSVLYRELFAPQVIYDPPLDRDDLKQDLDKRIKNSIPPGYKDARKDDGGLGDLIIWRTILEIGKENKAHLIFVSGDQKTDWWHQSEGAPLYPRFELVDEYRRCSDGHTLHLISFSDFLKLTGASQNIIEEVRREEQELHVPSDLFGEFAPHAFPDLIIESVVGTWLRRIHQSGRVLAQRGFPDFLVEADGGRIFGYEVRTIGNNLQRRLREIFSRDLHGFDRLYIILIADSSRSAASAIGTILQAQMPKNVSIVIGRIELPQGQSLPVFVPDTEEPPRSQWD